MVEVGSNGKPFKATGDNLLSADTGQNILFNKCLKNELMGALK